MDTIQKFKRKVGAGGSGLRGQTSKTEEPRIPQLQHFDENPPIPGGFEEGSNTQRPIGMDSPTVTPLDNIGKGHHPEQLETYPVLASNIETAIKACRPESNNSLQNRQEMQHVKEIDNDGYCDISGHAQDMRLVGA